MLTIFAIQKVFATLSLIFLYGKLPKYFKKKRRGKEEGERGRKEIIATSAKKASSFFDEESRKYTRISFSIQEFRLLHSPHQRLSQVFLC